MMRFTCRGCLDSAFVLCFTRFEALRGDAIHLQGASGLSICVVFCSLRLCQVMRFTCRECLDSAFVFCFARFVTLPGDAIQFHGVSRYSICIVFYMVWGSAGDAIHLSGNCHQAYPYSMDSQVEVEKIKMHVREKVKFPCSS